MFFTDNHKLLISIAQQLLKVDLEKHNELKAIKTIHTLIKYIDMNRDNHMKFMQSSTCQRMSDMTADHCYLGNESAALKIAFMDAQYFVENELNPNVEYRLRWPDSNPAYPEFTGHNLTRAQLLQFINEELAMLKDTPDTALIEARNARSELQNMHASGCTIA